MKFITAFILFLSFLFSSYSISDFKSTDEPEFVSPLQPGAVVLSNFGLRTHPLLQTQRIHKGVDFHVAEGDRVRASEKGIVIFAGERDEFGNFIMIQHANGFVTRYAHLERIGMEIKDGAKVDKGQELGLAGKSGQTTGPVLHFEILLDGEAKDPLKYLK